MNMRIFYFLPDPEYPLQMAEAVLRPRFAFQRRTTTDQCGDVWLAGDMDLAIRSRMVMQAGFFDMDVSCFDEWAGRFNGMEQIPGYAGGLGERIVRSGVERQNPDGADRRPYLLYYFVPGPRDEKMDEMHCDRMLMTSDIAAKVDSVIADAVRDGVVAAGGLVAVPGVEMGGTMLQGQAEPKPGKMMSDKEMAESMRTDKEFWGAFGPFLLERAAGRERLLPKDLGRPLVR